MGAEGRILSAANIPSYGKLIYIGGDINISTCDWDIDIQSCPDKARFYAGDSFSSEETASIVFTAYISVTPCVECDDLDGNHSVVYKDRIPYNCENRAVSEYDSYALRMA